MFRQLLGSRAFLSFGLIFALAIAAVVAYKLVSPTPEQQSYCAMMPDSVGLFVGSDVTVMGVRVGQVTDVAPDGDKARVVFDIQASRKLPPDVGATTLSDTLIADRKLALIGAEPTGPSLDPSDCITKTLTPKSLSQTFTAVAHLADQLNGASDPAHPNQLSGGLAALDRSMAGSGQQFNDIVKGLGAALNSPDAAIGRIGDLLDSLTALAASANNGWPVVKSTLTRLAKNLDDINNIIAPPIIDIVIKLVDILPPANDLSIMFVGPIVDRLDAVPNLPQMISAGVASLRDVLTMIPPIVGAFGSSIDPQTGRASLAYATPKVAIPDPAASQVCSAINLLAPGRCADASKGLVDVSLAQLVLGSVGAR